MEVCNYKLHSLLNRKSILAVFKTKDMLHCKVMYRCLILKLTLCYLFTVGKDHIVLDKKKKFKYIVCHYFNTLMPEIHYKQIACLHCFQEPV